MGRTKDNPKVSQEVNICFYLLLLQSQIIPRHGSLKQQFRMLTDPVGQEFEDMACLYNIISGASMRKTQWLGVTQELGTI